MQDPWNGKQLGNYYITHLLAQGGLGRVYFGRHKLLEFPIVVKVIRGDGNYEEMQSARSFLEQEARIVSSLDHPGIVKLLDFGVEEGEPFFIMPYASGGCMTSVQLPFARIVEVLEQIAPALQYAHDKQVVHRDIKPNNFLIDAQGRVLITDFGIATKTSSIDQGAKDFAGTLTYVSPEQINGKPVRASDQYSLGVCLFTWLCGKQPFTGDTTQLINSHLYCLPPSLRAINLSSTPNVRQFVSVNGFHKSV